MGTVTDIIDALRRIGTPTQKSALRRLDAHLEDRAVLAHTRRRTESPKGEVETLIATVEPVPETIVPLTPDEIRPILENAGLVPDFLKSFAVSTGSAWGLEDLDNSFRAWLEADDKLGYTDDAVIEILGAAFGEYCAKKLYMHWARLTDKDGTALVLEGTDRTFRAFPYHSISKRIPDREYGFFEAVFASLTQSSCTARRRDGVA